MASDNEYIDKMKTLLNAQVYELIDTETGARYIGWTRKDLESTRRNQHFAEARTGREDRALHAHLQQVEDEGREDDIEIRPLDFPSERRATEVIGLDNLLNGQPGNKKPPGGRYDWSRDELEVIEEHGLDIATRILREEYGRDASNLKNQVRDTRAQLGHDLSGRNRRKLTDEQVQEIWIRYHLDEGATHESVADEVDFDIHRSTVGRILNEESYADVSKPSKAAIEAAEVYVKAEAAYHACARTDASYAMKRMGADA